MEQLPARGGLHPENGNPSNAWIERNEEGGNDRRITYPRKEKFRKLIKEK